jgi:hypothetical protein
MNIRRDSRKIMRLVLLTVTFVQCFQMLLAQNQERVVKLQPEPWGPLLWKSSTQENCPVEQSDDLAPVIVFTGKHADYTYADTWYPSWASDDKMYSPYTDGVSGVWAESRSNLGKYAVTGQAVISGSDPLNLEIKPLGTTQGSAEPYVGRYPSASLVYDGIWYYGTYCLQDQPPGYNLGTLRPFTGFRISEDFGKTWKSSPYNCEIGLFEKNIENGNDEVIKIGAPHFVDFGKNMEHSPDGKAYLVAHGSVKEDMDPRPANNSWISGDQIYLTRVAPSIANINDKSKYEYYCGKNNRGESIWSDDFSKIMPIFEWNNKCGCVTITYNSKLKKYIMCITDGWPTIKFMDTYLLESDNIEGPYNIVAYMENFGEQGYFVNIPTKFISEDGYTSWLSYSGNFATFDDLRVNPPGGRYGWILQEIKFLTHDEYEKYSEEKMQKKVKKEVKRWNKENPLTDKSNLVLQATVKASSVGKLFKAGAVNDGVADGFPNNINHEWASDNETAGAKIRLTWDKEISVSKVWLFDRPSHNEHIKGLNIQLSDGSNFQIGELPNSEYAAKELTFDKKEIKWLEITVTSVGRATNIGLAEIAVFE